MSHLAAATLLHFQVIWKHQGIMYYFLFSVRNVMQRKKTAYFEVRRYWFLSLHGEQLSRTLHENYTVY